MHDQSTSTPAQQEIDTDAEIMRMQLIDWRGPWAVEEIGRELQDPTEAADGLTRLARAGLIHRLDGFVFATRAAGRGQLLAL